MAPLFVAYSRTKAPNDNPHDSAPATTAPQANANAVTKTPTKRTTPGELQGRTTFPPKAEVAMRGENGYPITPDWLPEPHPVVDISAHVDPPAHEAQPLTWLGDDG